jgi:hypothetical protein
MKRLFEVNGVFFDNKEKAKQARKPGESVHLGPDHDRYGVHGNPKTHSHNALSGGSGDGFKRTKKRKAVRK